MLTWLCHGVAMSVFYCEKHGRTCEYFCLCRLASCRGLLQCFSVSSGWRQLCCESAQAMN